MKKLFLIRGSLTNQMSFYHLMLLLVSLPFDIFYSHLILVSFAVHTAIQFKKEQVKQVPLFKIILLQSVFFITVISTIYTENKAEAFTEWGRQITIFALPILCYFNTLDIKKYRQSLLLVFSVVCTLCITYLYYDALKTIHYYKLPVSAIFSSAFTNHNFSDPIGMHATFFALQVTMALTFILSGLIKQLSKYQRVFYIVCAIVLAIGLVQLSSKSVFVVMVFVVIAAIPCFLLSKGSGLKYMAVASTTCVLVLAVILTSVTFKTRYFTELKNDFSLSGKSTTTEPRIARWMVAGEVISQSPIIGHGAGSETGLLHDKFFEKKYYSSFINHLNSHSQYLSFLIKSGVIGLIIYLYTLWIGFKEALRNKDLLFFTFMVLVATVSISENMLDVDKGIFFYAVFFSLFVFSNNTKALPELQEIIVTEGNQVLV